jgi:phosphatidylglycerol lysyltransferase
VIAQIAGLISHVPGGLGVFEAVMLAGFGATGNEALAAPILGALVVFRVVYYSAAAVRRHRDGAAARGARACVRSPADAVVHRLVAIVLCRPDPGFRRGTAVLRCYPCALPKRMEILREVLPLSVLEVSHLLASVIGMLLLILARGLQRRLDAAYVLTLVLLVAGACSRCSRASTTKKPPCSPCWRWRWRRRIGCSIGALRCSAPRFRWAGSGDRCGAGCAVAGGNVQLQARRLQQRPVVGIQLPSRWRAACAASAGGGGGGGHAVCAGQFDQASKLHREPPTEAELAQALPLIKQFPSAQAHLALMGDKTLLFDAEQGVRDVRHRRPQLGHMGDPVGANEDVRRELVWAFLEQCERAGGWPVFYQVSPADLDLYLEVGMNLLKIGEEARVRLDGFNLDGKSKKVLRNTVNKLGRDGLRLEIVPAEAVAPLMPRLKEISDAWMGDKRGREKRFSLGAFDPRYLVRTPMAVVWQNDKLVAFANLFLTETSEEASVDLMRFLPDGPAGIMDYLFVELMQWAQVKAIAGSTSAWLRWPVCRTDGRHRCGIASARWYSDVASVSTTSAGCSATRTSSIRNGNRVTWLCLVVLPCQ